MRRVHRNRILNIRLSYSNVVATVALFVALGGTSVAAVTLARNSVKSRHIAADAVTEPKVKDASLSAEDFAPGELPEGEQGPSGQQGPKGDMGPSGPQGPRGEMGPSGLQGAKGDQGASGPMGPTGGQGAKGDAGNPGANGSDGLSFTWRGEWDGGTEYAPREAVGYAGSAYVATDQPSGDPPDVDTDAWDLMAAKGEEGPQGPEGPATGPAGGDLTGNYPFPLIANNAVNSEKVVDNILTGNDIKDLTGGDITDGSLTGSDIAGPESLHTIGASGEPAFRGGWTGSGPVLHAPARYYYDAVSRRVYFQGSVTNGDGSTSCPFIMPSNLRPAESVHDVALLDRLTSADFVRITVWSDGQVCVNRTGVGSDDISLNGLSYRVG